MALSIGIVGLPNVGKSTLFNALTDANALAANYPFATIEPNTGVVPVPDTRLAKLSEIYASAPLKPASVTFVDIAGLVAGASRGEGLGNQFLAHIRSCNAICQVVRAFDNGDIQRASSTDPASDIAVINTELTLADIATVERRLVTLAKEVKADAKLAPKLALVEKLKASLDNGQLAGQALDASELAEISDLQLLTAKPFVFCFNLDENQLANAGQQTELAALVAPAPSVFVSAKLEDELKSLDASDQTELLASYGATASGLEKLINASYQALGLQSFLTAGEKEVRAWTIKRGATAPEAAGAIHGDFERGFIAAEIVSYDDLVASGSLAAARAAGKVRTEGKNYVMQEGDVVEFKFNVSR